MQIKSPQLWLMGVFIEFKASKTETGKCHFGQAKWFIE
jgi:hypothetical protein